MSRALRGESQPSACAWVALPASRATPWAKWPPTLLRAQAFMHAPGTHRARPPRGRGRGAGSSCESSACADLEDEELQLALMLSASESAVPAEWAPVQSAAGRCAAPAHAASWQGEGWQSALEQRLAEQQQQWQAGLWQPGQLASGTRGAEGGEVGRGCQPLLDEEEALALAIRLSEEETRRGARSEVEHGRAEYESGEEEVSPWGEWQHGPRPTWDEAGRAHEPLRSPSAPRLGISPSPPSSIPPRLAGAATAVLPPAGRGRGRGRGRLPEWAEPEAAPGPNQGLGDDEALELALRLSAADARYEAGGGGGDRGGGGGGGESGSGRPVSQESLAEWATSALAPLVEGGGVAPDVLAEIVLSLETDDDVAEYCTEFLGRSTATSSFVAEVCARRQNASACGSAR